MNRSSPPCLPPRLAASPAPKPLRVLLPEGSSTSAREVLTVLGLAGHVVEVCDPDAHCLARFSRFVKRFHRCPGLRKDPAALLAFIENLLAARQFDVVLPTHEQGLLLARARPRLETKAAIALPSFAGYRAAHSKAGFSRLLTELGLPQPKTDIVASAAQLRAAARFPCVVKAAIGTGSRAVWMVRDPAGLNEALAELGAGDGFAEGVLVQDFVDGPTEKAQAVFGGGALLGFHATRQIMAGAGGGDACKESVHRPQVRAHLALLGQRLAWHGALSVDYMLPDGISSDTAATPLYIDCNPRLVEPMSAYLAGTDLVQLLLQVSLGETPAAAADGRAGVRTHQAIQVLFGAALRGATRREICRQGWHLLTRQGGYAGSIEELTPLRLDWISAWPLVLTFILLGTAPSLAHRLARRGWGAHLLEAETIRRIAEEDFG